MGRQRARLVAALGSRCHACRTRAGSFIDHDHFTGLVRGLLCEYCNTHIDGCLHVSGCVWADYLNSPPAVELKLSYPKPERVGDRDATGRRSSPSGLIRCTEAGQPNAAFFPPLWATRQIDPRRCGERVLPSTG
jgi:hypothetical protein